MQKIGEYTYAGGADWQTTGLTLSITKRYVIFAEFIATNTGGVKIYVNNDTTATNYQTQRGYAVGASPGAARANDANFAISTVANEVMNIQMFLSFQQGVPCFNIVNAGGTATATTIVAQLSSTRKTAAVASITQIDLIPVAGTITSTATMAIYEMQ